MTSYTAETDSSISTESEASHRNELLSALLYIFAPRDQVQGLKFAASFGAAGKLHLNDIAARSDFPPDQHVIFDSILRFIRDNDPRHILEILMAGLTHPLYGEDILKTLGVVNLTGLVELITRAIDEDDVSYSHLLVVGQVDGAVAEYRFEQRASASAALEVCNSYLRTRLQDEPLVGPSADAI